MQLYPPILKEQLRGVGLDKANMVIEFENSIFNTDIEKEKIKLRYVIKSLSNRNIIEDNIEYSDTNKFSIPLDTNGLKQGFYKIQLCFIDSDISKLVFLSDWSKPSFFYVSTKTPKIDLDTVKISPMSAKIKGKINNIENDDYVKSVTVTIKEFGKNGKTLSTQTKYLTHKLASFSFNIIPPIGFSLKQTYYFLISFETNNYFYGELEKKIVSNWQQINSINLSQNQDKELQLVAYEPYSNCPYSFCSQEYFQWLCDDNQVSNKSGEPSHFTGVLATPRITLDNEFIISNGSYFIEGIDDKIVRFTNSGDGYGSIAINSMTLSDWIQISFLNGHICTLEGLCLLCKTYNKKLYLKYSDNNNLLKEKLIQYEMENYELISSDSIINANIGNSELDIFNEIEMGKKYFFLKDVFPKNSFYAYFNDLHTIKKDDINDIAYFNKEMLIQNLTTYQWNNDSTVSVLNDENETLFDTFLLKFNNSIINLTPFNELDENDKRPSIQSFVNEFYTVKKNGDNYHFWYPIDNSYYLAFDNDNKLIWLCKNGMKAFNIQIEDGIENGIFIKGNKYDIEHSIDNLFIECKNKNKTLFLKPKLTKDGIYLIPCVRLREENNIVFPLETENNEYLESEILRKNLRTGETEEICSNLDCLKINGSGIIEDRTIESGVDYEYYQFVDNTTKENTLFFLGKYGKKLEFPVLTGHFDGKTVDLPLPYNTSFGGIKETRADSSVETIGSSYPFVRRNSILQYRQFPIDSLISENSSLYDDFSKCLISQMKDSSNKQLGYYKYREETLESERFFREKVKDFLTDGKPKLLRTPSEGNLLIKLTEVTFTPNTSLNNKISTFSATAIEIGSPTLENCKKYFNIYECGVNENNGY